jgi:hypothetical protein
MLEIQTAAAWTKEKGLLTSNENVSYVLLAKIKQSLYY